MSSKEDRYFFVNKILVLFLLLSALVFGLIGVTILISLAFKDHDSFSSVAGALADIGSFFGGTAAVVAAIIALRGFDTWKKQLKHGKNIEVIWDALEQLRRTHNAYLRWFSQSRAAANIINTTTPDITIKTALDESILLLEQHFTRLDILVFKKDDPGLNHEWNQYAKNIRKLIERADDNFNKYEPSNTVGPYGSIFPGRFEVSISLDPFKRHEKRIHTLNELDKMQSKINDDLDKYWFPLDKKLVDQESTYI